MKLAIAATALSLLGVAKPTEIDNNGDFHRTLQGNNGNAKAAASGLTFNIELILKEEALENKATFDFTKAKWESVITSHNIQGPFGPFTAFPSYLIGACALEPLPEFIEDLNVCGTFEPIDGPGKILGISGPLYFDVIPGTTIKKPFNGIMLFDSADIDSLKRRGLLDTVILHEMGHILGIGTLWDTSFTGETLELIDTRGYPRFGCPYLPDSNASREWGKVSNCRGQSVPIEDSTGNPGTDCGHFDEACLPNELMSGFLTNEINYLSTITIGSLEDLGYFVDYREADSYNFKQIPDFCSCNPGNGNRSLRSTRDQQAKRKELRDKRRRKLSAVAFDEAIAFGKAQLSKITSQPPPKVAGLHLMPTDRIRVYAFNEENEIVDVLVTSDP